MDDLDTDLWTTAETDFPDGGAPSEQSAFLVRYAILAPSSHNTQPWAFRVLGHTVDVHVDPAGWLPVADPDRRELHLSVGCAVENLVVAARRFGFDPAVAYRPGLGDEAEGDGPAARIRLRPAGTDPDPGTLRLFRAIPRRHTNHGVYDGRPLPEQVRAALDALELEDGTEIHLTDDPRVRRRVDELTARADALQFADPEWRRELGRWIGRGVFATNWILSKLGQLAVTHLDLSGSTARKDRELLGSASLLGLVATRTTGMEARLRAGRSFQRFFLAATAEGLALQPMNQVLQVPEVRREFDELLPEGWGRPQLTFRLGFAEPEEPAPRRPLPSFLHPVS